MGPRYLTQLWTGGRVYSQVHLDRVVEEKSVHTTCTIQQSTVVYYHRNNNKCVAVEKCKHAKAITMILARLIHTNTNKQQK
jgi:hypothetical protein